MKLAITLPDGSTQEFKKGITLREIAESLGPDMKNAALAGAINGQVVDLETLVTENAAIRLITFADPEGREIYRHSASHVMAQAVKRLFPGVKLAIGPAIEDGFYYDFEFPETISSEVLPQIEAEMKKIIAADLKFQRQELSRSQAITMFDNQGEKFKVEILQELEDEAKISVYKNGEFFDLCRGPHVPSTGYIQAFKLTSVAGAYWRGDERREMLQRIYGTAFPTEEQLEEYLRLLEEARARDHRKLGRELDLFSFHEEGTGFPFFHPKGTVVYDLLIDYCRKELDKLGYVEVITPAILHEELWHRSGHWDNYKKNMYFTSIDDRPYAVKPMNCPGGLLIYKTRLHSYRELPLKVAEFGLVHRHELSGVLHGLFRVRSFTQDDAHIYCLPEQLEEQIQEAINLLFHIYRDFGFENYDIELSTRPLESIGTAEMWEQATTALRNSLEALNIPFEINPGEGAFYGPKIDFHIKDCLKRTWQCGTIQVDFSMPERFDLTYVGPDGQPHRPAMIHRAIFGSIERFLGILIEHHNGNFPLWLAPVQIAVLTIADRHIAYANEVVERLKAAGFRVTTDFQEDTIGHKIREAERQKIPCMLIIGDREQKNRNVSLRRHLLGDKGSISIEELIAQLQQEIATKKIYHQE